jgi:predicted transcriptional regulator
MSDLVNENEVWVLNAIEPGHAALISDVRRRTKLNAVVVSEALASLGARGYVVVRGSGKRRGFHVTDEGEAFLAARLKAPTPLAIGVPTGPATFKVLCPHCGSWHYHGNPDPPNDVHGYGQRAADCAFRSSSGYFAVPEDFVLANHPSFVEAMRLADEELAASETRPLSELREEPSP